MKSSRNNTISPNGSEISALLVNPATMYDKNDINAATIAYGSCVETWFTWLHCAPAEDIIVVSEIGEQWSPHTAPAIHAEIAIIIIV